MCFELNEKLTQSQEMEECLRRGFGELGGGEVVEVLGVLFAFGVFLNNPAREVFGIKFNSYLKVFFIVFLGVFSFS